MIDKDLGLAGSRTDQRSGFARLIGEVAQAHVGIVLGLEVRAWPGTTPTGIACWKSAA